MSCAYARNTCHEFIVHGLIPVLGYHFWSASQGCPGTPDGNAADEFVESLNPA